MVQFFDPRGRLLKDSENAHLTGVVPNSVDMLSSMSLQTATGNSIPVPMVGCILAPVVRAFVEARRRELIFPWSPSLNTERARKRDSDGELALGKSPKLSLEPSPTKTFLSDAAFRFECRPAFDGVRRAAIGTLEFKSSGAGRASIKAKVPRTFGSV